MNFNLYALDIFNLIFKRYKKLEIKHTSLEMKKFLKAISCEYVHLISNSVQIGKSRTLNPIFHVPLSPHTIHVANSNLNNGFESIKDSRPKFRKPEETHLPHDDSEMHVIR